MRWPLLGSAFLIFGSNAEVFTCVPAAGLKKEVCRRSGASRALHAKNFSAAQCANTNS